MKNRTRERAPLLALLVAAVVATAPEPAAQASKGRDTAPIEDQDSGLDTRRLQKLNQEKNPRIDRADPSQLDPNDAAGAPLTTPPDVVAPGAPVEAPTLRGTPWQGLREIERLTNEGRPAAGAALARDILARVPDSPRYERLRAELSYACGVATNVSGEHVDAVAAFESAGALASAGELRLDSLYNASVSLLEEGHRLYDEIPEIAAKRMAEDPLVKESDVGMGPDTLPDAKARYAEAREILLERLRQDWRDADTRASLELAQRRLERIARIEENRNDPTSDKKSEDGNETEKTEKGEESSEGEEESDSQREEDGETGRNPDSQEEHADDAEPQPGEGGQEGDESPNPDAEAEEDATQPKLEEQEEGEEDPELTSESGGAELDPEMSQEEVKMILDRLHEIDENAKKLRAAILRTRKIPVERDW